MNKNYMKIFLLGTGIAIGACSNLNNEQRFEELKANEILTSHKFEKAMIKTKLLNLTK